MTYIIHPPDLGDDRFRWWGLGLDPKEPFFSDLVRRPLYGVVIGLKYDSMGIFVYKCNTEYLIQGALIALDPGWGH